MNHQETMTFILEAAIDGITKSYLARKDTEGHLEMLVQKQLLAELADKDRSHVAYRTTHKGLQYLLAHRSLHGAVAVVEA